jgi:hypothetical protein
MGLNVKEMNAALKEMFKPQPPRLDQEGDMMIMRCSTCPAEARFQHKDKAAYAKLRTDGWELVKYSIAGAPGGIDPYCPDCFPRAQGLYESMKAAGLMGGD